MRLSSPAMSGHARGLSSAQFPASLQAHKAAAALRAKISKRKRCASSTLVAAASPSAQSSTQQAEDQKAKLERMAGLKHGLDKSDEEKRAVAAVVKELADLKRIDPLNLAGSRWKLVFTESTASSSGKIGPFIGRTEQEFPANQPGQYINWCYLGPLTLSLLADYKQSSPERIDVTFQYIQVEAGPFKWQKELKNSGTWDSLYIDEGFRVLRANNKNLFVLKKMATS